MSALSDLLNNARGDASVDALLERAQAAGHSIDRGTVFRALKGDHAKSPREETLIGLAAVFNVDIRDVRAAVGRPVGELEPYTPPAYADRLSHEQRKALNELIRTIVETEVEASERQPTRRPLRALPSKTRQSAARDTGRPSRGQLDRDAQDATGEPPANDPEDMEPR